MRPASLALVLLLAAASGSLAAQAPAAPTPPRDHLLVCNKAAHSLSIFVPGERREVATLPTGRGPHEVAVAADGNLAVVTDYGDQKPGQTLTVVDIGKRQVVRTIDLVAAETDAEGKPRQKAFLRPHGVQFVAADKVVVTSESSRRLLLVDVAKGTIERTWTTPQATMHMVSVSSDLRTAAATSIKDGNVVLFALAGDGPAASAPITCGEESEGLAVQPGTGLVWVGNRRGNTVSVVDPTTAKVTHTLATGDFPFRIAFTADGKQALVSCAEGGQVMVFDAKTHAVLREVSIHADGSELSAMPMGLAVDPDGARAYVACGRGEFVAVVDLAAGTVVDRLPARAGCDGIAFARTAAAPAADGLRR